MSRLLSVTVTLAGTCPESWDTLQPDEIKARAEAVAKDTVRQVFRSLPGLVVNATATVEEGAR